jgi:hypothetical protein
MARLYNLTFGQAIEYLLSGRKVKARQWTAEQYLVFNGNVWSMPENHLCTIAELNIWRQLYKQWEVIE